MSAERLERSTNGLKGHCSTIELRAQVSVRLHSITLTFLRQRKIALMISVLITMATSSCYNYFELPNFRTIDFSMLTCYYPFA